MHPEPALDQHTEPRLGAQFDAIASAIVDIESLLAIVPGLDLSGDHPSAKLVLMGRVDIVPQEAYPSSCEGQSSPPTVRQRRLCWTCFSCRLMRNLLVHVLIEQQVTETTVPGPVMSISSMVGQRGT
jgi:hypothetical protein